MVLQLPKHDQLRGPSQTSDERATPTNLATIETIRELFTTS